MNEQMAERVENLSNRSQNDDSPSAILDQSSAMRFSVSDVRRFSAVDSFRFSKDILCRMTIKELGILLSCLMPLVQVSDNRYLIGATTKEIVVKTDRILIKGSTGFEELNTFIARYALSECLIIWRIM